MDGLVCRLNTALSAWVLEMVGICPILTNYSLTIRSINHPGTPVIPLGQRPGLSSWAELLGKGFLAVAILDFGGGQQQALFFELDLVALHVLL